MTNYRSLPLSQRISLLFSRASQKVTKLARPWVIAALETHTGYRLLVTGHSLGAGTAVMATLLWLNDAELRSKLECVAFAPPPIFRPKSGELSYMVDGREVIDIYIHRHVSSQIFPEQGSDLIDLRQTRRTMENLIFG